VKILFAVNIPYPEGRANTRRIRTIARELVKQGHSVIILLPFTREPQARHQIIDGVYVHCCLMPTCSSDFLNKKNNVKLHIQIISRLKWIIELYKATKRFEYEWLYLYQPGIDGFAAAMLAKYYGRKIVSEYVDMLSPNGFDGPVWRLIYSTLLLADRLVPQYADVVLTISSDLRIKYHQRKIKAPVMLFPTLVDTLKFGNGDGDHFRRDLELGERRIVVFTGSFVRSEGLHLLIKAVSRVVKKYNDVFLIVAGGSLVSDSDNANELIARFGLQENALFLGMIPESDVIDLQAAADVLVMPKLDDPINHAGLSTKLSEYLAAGKAVIASKVGDVDKYLKDDQDALLVPPGDCKALENALLRLLGDTDLRLRLGRNGRKVAEEKFDVGVNVRQLIKTLSIIY
jgi:glycosyltransferase involved in cell wall biosynthesis